MILNAVLFGHGSHEAAWRAPGQRATAPLELSHWMECACAAETAGFDGLFVGDILCLQDRPDSHPSETLDPFLVLATLAAVTDRLTLIGTASTSFNHPVHLARRLLTLHHLSGGRAGWNIVTSSYPQEAQLFGWDDMPPTRDRYALAEEVVKAVCDLWSAWDGVERQADATTGRWLDAAPNPVSISGRFGQISGTLNLSPEPYGPPLLAQAGSSPEGQRFAACHADQIFTVQSEIEGAKAFRTVLRRLAAEAGRSPDSLKILPGIVPFIATTRQEAEEKLIALTRLVGTDHLIPKLERFTGLSLAHLDLDDRFPYSPDDLRENAFSNSRARLLVREAQRLGLTLRQLAGRFAAGRGHLLVVGTGSDVAATMTRWIEGGAADGFNVMPPLLPDDLSLFGKQVMPLLRDLTPRR